MIIMRKLLLAVSLIVLLTPVLTQAAGDTDSPARWLRGLPSPDAVVLTASEIGALNALILTRTDQMAQMSDIASMPDVVPGDKLREWLSYDPLPDLASVRRYNARGKVVGQAFLDEAALNINIGAVAASNPVRFGVMTERADIRGLPTAEALLREPDEVDFDTVQYSSIYPPAPVALLHTSMDGKWGFFQTPFVRGWMRLDSVAFANRGDVSLSTATPLVITGSRVLIYGDAKEKTRLASVPMGAAFAIIGEETGAWLIRFPKKGKDGLEWITGYVDKGADARKGFLLYTQRNIITQAFKMLGEGYAWGGLGGGRDCSEFLRDAFATVGVNLPRNSQQQVNAGKVRPDNDGLFTADTLRAALHEARPGVTLFVTPGHIMLYLGEKSGAPYVIHQAHGYTLNGEKHIVDRVVVSGLGNHGKETGLWPLLPQIRAVTEVALPIGTSPFPGQLAAQGGVKGE